MTTLSAVEAPIQALSTRLMAGAMVTETLLEWCEEHGLSHGPITVEIRQRFSPAAVPDDVFAALEPAPGTNIHYRQVQLMRGKLPLAIAENWFVPQRLTPGMNHRLQTTDVPFGAVIAPLHPSRRTLMAHIPPSAVSLRPGNPDHHSRPATILEHKAAVLSRSGAVLAVVRECFLSELVSRAFTASSGTRAAEYEV